MAKKETKSSKAAAAKDEKKEPVAKKETPVIQEEVKDQNVVDLSDAGATISTSEGKGISEEEKSLKSKEIEPSEKEVSEDNKKQAEKVSKLKAVLYNRHRGMSFQKLSKKISLEDLQAKKNLPLDSGRTSEFIMDNGLVFSLERGLTKENRDYLLKTTK